MVVKITRIGEMGYKCNILVEISEGKGPLRRYRRRYENIKIYLKGRRYENGSG
jgi:hypothetical protein